MMMHGAECTMKALKGYKKSMGAFFWFPKSTGMILQTWESVMAMGQKTKLISG